MSLKSDAGFALPDSMSRNRLAAERSLYAADDALAQSERDFTLALIALYRASGGGWQTASSEITAAETR